MAGPLKQPQPLTLTLHPSPFTLHPIAPMTRYFPAALLAAGSIALGLVAGNQARLISESDSAAAAAPAALPFLFFATAAAPTKS